MRNLNHDTMLLEIQDDGVGFDKAQVASATEQRGSLGLKNMSERAEMVNGVFRLESAVGKGTIIRVVIPLTEASTERLRKGS
jgi:signal transduction histidine kinase